MPAVFAGDLGEGPCARLPVCEGEATKKGKRNSTEDSASPAASLVGTLAFIITAFSSRGKAPLTENS